MKYKFSKTARKKAAFTLAEVLITLAIIGVVAAITIPSVIVNTNQMEFKTGLRKAVSVLNQAITLNKALTGESPYDNTDLYNYLQQNMSVMRGKILVYNSSCTNKGFYTTDGMLYEIPEAYPDVLYSFPLYENKNILLNKRGYAGGSYNYVTCGSMGLSHNPDGTTNPPCVITVDVNGDRKPFTFSNYYGPEGVNKMGYTEYYTSGDIKRHADPNGRLLTDTFSILITDQGAIPYGVVAQKAMYQAQK